MLGAGTEAINAGCEDNKAFFRRGKCYRHLGELDKANSFLSLSLLHAYLCLSESWEYQSSTLYQPVSARINLVSAGINPVSARISRYQPCISRYQPVSTLYQPIGRTGGGGREERAKPGAGDGAVCDNVKHLAQWA